MKYKIMFCRFGCRWMYPDNAAGVGMKNECPECYAKLDFVQSDHSHILRRWCEQEKFAIPAWLKQ